MWLLLSQYKTSTTELLCINGVCVFHEEKKTHEYLRITGHIL